MSDMDDGIQVTIGLDGLPTFFLFDSGASIPKQLGPEELKVCVAVLRDLADALEHKQKKMTN